MVYAFLVRIHSRRETHEIGEPVRLLRATAAEFRDAVVATPLVIELGAGRSLTSTIRSSFQHSLNGSIERGGTEATSPLVPP
jgi:hypothetical protein